MMNILKKSLFLAALLLGLVACGDDSGTGAKDDDSSSSSSVEESSSSVVSSSSSDVISSEVERSSSSAKSSSSSSVIPDPDRGSSSSSSSVAKSSSSGDSEYDFVWNSLEEWTDFCDETKDGKIGYAPYRSDKGVFMCSYNATKKKWQWTQIGGISSSSAKSSSSSVKVSSSSVYVPYDHSKALASETYIARSRYKQFTDSRNGRSYYYITIVGRDTNNVKDSVTVMAENLNIGKDVAGVDDQNDDSVIERYYYKDDTTYCDEYGGLYQWAEMMQLPSRCNTESCADLIKENHQGICPDGWRLFTENDFHIVVTSEDNDDGVKGLRSSAFTGSNASGFSLLAAGMRGNGSDVFAEIIEAAYWYYPQEPDLYSNWARIGFLGMSNYTYPSNSRREKTKGFSVRCVKLETEPSSVSE